jgi:ArsR family transcriptional regulator, arsenate/arsenite/antimonite-responsive transcriptional repressor
MESKSAVSALGALAHATRLEVFRLLVRAGVAGLAVNKIAEALGVEANGRLSFHLKELVAAGLATTRQEGRFIYYATNYPAMTELLRYLTEDCCGGQPCGESVVACNQESSL